MSDRYIDLVLGGRALWSDIDNHVDRWHEGEVEMPLHDYLGLTWDEYALWVEQPRSLRLIIAARERGKPVLELVARAHDYELAARGGLSEPEVRVVREWLQKTGRLPPN
jgi:hypothetical protein